MPTDATDVSEDAANTPFDVESHRESMRLALRDAMRARDDVRVRVLRALMHALDNLGVLADVHTDDPLPKSPSAATERPRRIPIFAEVAARLRAEVDEREAAARTYDDVERADAAARLRAEAAVAREWLID